MTSTPKVSPIPKAAPSMVLGFRSPNPSLPPTSVTACSSALLTASGSCPSTATKVSMVATSAFPTSSKLTSQAISS